MKDKNELDNNGIDRRGFLSKSLVAGAGLAVLTGAETGSAQNRRPDKPRRRRLGKLEVSAIGMGVQNMHRKYDTSVPYRPEMIKILRAAYDRGVTFFDCAEAYGP